MLMSFVIPAYNASGTIDRTLSSVFSTIIRDDWEVEAIVVDDGGSDRAKLEQIVSRYPNTKVIEHAENRGMCASRNTGISRSKGDFVFILDADDLLIKDWQKTLSLILDEWPDHIKLCYSVCKNPSGVVTASQPGYRGELSLEDLLNEQVAGEYMPIFRGDYVRQKQYIDLGMRKSCGIVSYISYAQDGPFWVTPLVLRIYFDVCSGSVSSNWVDPKKAAETVSCYKEVFSRYGALYKEFAPKVYRTKLLRFSIYLRLARFQGAWKTWAK